MLLFSFHVVQAMVKKCGSTNTGVPLEGLGDTACGPLCLTSFYHLLSDFSYIFIDIYIYNQCHQGNVISISIWPHPFLIPKKAKTCTFARK